MFACRQLGVLVVLFSCGCVSSADLTPETAAIAVAEQTTGFSPYTATSGETYEMAASLEKVGDATVLLVRGNAQSPVIGDIDAATLRVEIAAREYAAANICRGSAAALTPARASGAYDLKLDGWGYKVRCGEGN